MAARIDPDHRPSDASEFEGLTEAATIAVINGVADRIADDAAGNGAKHRGDATVLGRGTAAADDGAGHGARDAEYGIAVTAAAADETVVVAPVIPAIAAGGVAPLAAVVVAVVASR